MRAKINILNVLDRFKSGGSILLVFIVFSFQMISHAQCLSASNGLYPSTTYTPSCTGSNETITTVAYAGEYSKVNVISGNQYTFSSSNASDYLTISNEAGTVSYAYGTTPVVWTTSFTGVVRFYTHTNSSCGEESILRERVVSCTVSVCADEVISGSTSFPFIASGTTCGEGDDFSSADACSSSYLNGEDYVYEYTPDSDVDVTVNLSTDASWVGVIITEGCPDTGSCLDVVSSSSSTANGGPYSLTSGTSYYFTVSTYPSPDCIPNYTLTIDDYTTGNGVDGAWPGYNLGTLSCPATIVNSGNTTSENDDCAYVSGPDHIYNFSLSEQADVTIYTCGSSYDTRLYLYDLTEGSCSSGNYIAYNDDDCNLQSNFTVSALPAGDYVVVLEGYLGAEGSYDLTIDLTNCGGGCPNCSNGIRDCQETGVDCGGPDCPPCGGYLHPTVGLQNTYCGGCMIPTCGGKYYDNGGAFSNYSNSINQVYQTFCPEDAGKCLRATFSVMDVEPDYDYLMVINGPTQNSDKLWWGWGNMDDATLETNEGNWNSGVFTSTDASGCLTFRFSSDGSTNYDGWDVTFSCEDCSWPNGTDPNDCANSIEVCNNFDFSGASSGPGLTNDGCLGCVTSENYSNWYTIDIMSSGTVAFTIIPVTSMDDYDFALYESYHCEDLGTPVRCSYAANVGNTGLQSGAGDNSEDVTGDAWVNDVNVTEGETYYLLINNWSPSGDGFDLTWGLTNGASLGVQPKIKSAVNGSGAQFEVEISEAVQCSSVSSDGSDFVLECSGSTTEAECLANSIVAASPMNCANDSTRWLLMTLANPLPTAKAAYENDWRIVCSGTNAVVDVCHNPLDGGNPDILLPVDFLYLSAICHDEYTEINWTTAIEINNDYFTVQRSADAENFVDVAHLNAIGNSYIPTDYYYFDDEATSGLHYYRIKQTDFDGYSSYSDMVQVNCASELDCISMSPNPCGDFMDVRVNDSGVKFFNIRTMVGDVVLSFEISETNEMYRISGLSSLPSGIYVLEIGTESLSSYRSFIKQ